jgi:hypothetical protein
MEKDMLEGDDEKTFMDIILNEDVRDLEYLGDPEINWEKVFEEAEILVHRIFDKLDITVTEDFHDDNLYIVSSTFADKETVLAFVKEALSRRSADVFEVNDGYAVVENITLGDLCKIVGIRCDFALDLYCEVGFDPFLVR